MAKLGQSERQIYRQCGLADASFAGADGNDGINSGEGLRARRGLSGTRWHMSTQEITWKEESWR
jgi:hypothetical protein